MIIKREFLLNSLRNFCQVLDIDIKSVIESENPEKIVYQNPNLKSSSIKKLTLIHFQSIFQSWEDKFECEITIFTRIHALKYYTYEKDIEDLLEEIKSLDPDDIVDVSFTINKEEFCKDIFGEIPDTFILFYLFEENVINILRGKLDQIERILFKDHKLKSIVVILDRDIYISGPHLAFIGGKFIEERWNNILPKEPSEIGRFEEIWQIKDEETKWAQINTRLTPLHFLYEECSDEGKIGNEIDVMLINLIILYLANESKLVDGYIMTTFEGMNKIAIRLSYLEESLNPKHLLDLFLWSYDDKAPDKLSIIRNIISLILRQDSGENYGLLIEKAGHIYNAAKSNYKIYITQTIEKYFKARKEVIDYISSVSQQLSEQVSKITSSLVTNMLTTIAAIIGVFLVYAISPDFNPMVFKYGMKAYAIYILAFPCIYTMSHNFSEYRAIMEDFYYRKNLFSGFMLKEDIDEIIGNIIIKRRRNFMIFLVITVLFYLIVVVVIWIFSDVDLSKILGSPITFTQLQLYNILDIRR